MHLKRNRKIIFLLFFLLFSLSISCNNQVLTYKKIKGEVFGTTFCIEYSDSSKRNFNNDFFILFNDFNNSLSTYHPKSLISQLNGGLSELKVDRYFVDVFKLSKKMHLATESYFDPTVGKIVNASGFGPQKINPPFTKNKIDSLLQYVDFEKVRLEKNTIVKENKNINLDFNAIAKGYALDLISIFLEDKKIENYLIEIGGEIRAKGKNKNNKYWTIGIENPNPDGTRSLKKILQLKNESLATSGNYRKFKIDEITGEKTAHTFDPKKGSLIPSDLLSASVISSSLSCAEVDAYATAFIAMGYQKAKEMSKKNEEIKVFFIYLNGNKIETYTSPSVQFLN